MKPRVQEQIHTIEAVIDQLRFAAEAAVDAFETIQATQKDLRKEHWRHRKELATLSRTVEEFTELDSQNERYRECVGNLRETLQSLLTSIKTLRAEFRT